MLQNTKKTKNTINKKENIKDVSQKGGRCICGRGKKKGNGIYTYKNVINQKRTCKGGLALSSGIYRWGIGKKAVNGVCIKTKKIKKRW